MSTASIVSRLRLTPRVNARTVPLVQNVNALAELSVEPDVDVFAVNPLVPARARTSYLDRAAARRVAPRVEVYTEPVTVEPPGGIVDEETGEWLQAPTWTPPAPGTETPYNVTPPPPIVPLIRVSPIMPRIADSGLLWNGVPDPDLYKPDLETTLRQRVGRIQVIVGGRDVTFLRGGQTRVDEFGFEEPFGPSICTITFPQVTGYESRTVVPFAQVEEPVMLKMVHMDGTKTPIWTGYVVGLVENFDDGTEGPNTVLTCQGSLFQSDHILAQPRLLTGKPRDVGHVLADLLNDVPGRRYKWTKPVTTGIMTTAKGEWNQLLTGLISDILSTATTDDGEDQWSIFFDPADGGHPRIALKSSTESTVHRISLGTPGISASLSRDLFAQCTTIFGAGEWNGRAYSNLRSPHWQSPDVPSFPGTISLGDRGKHVKMLQKRLRVLGYDVDPDGHYTASDARWVRRAQKDAGLTVSGTVGPNTWQALFEIGDAGRLDAQFYAPFASRHNVEKWLYRANGTIRVPNPDHDKNAIRIDRFRRFGNVSKAAAHDSAEQELARDGNRGGAVHNRVGSITLNIDPENTNRWSIRPGHLFRVYGLHADEEPFYLRITSVLFEDSLQQVTCQVSTEKHDYLTLSAIKTRNREAATAARSRHSRRSAAPTVTVVDGELAGHIDVKVTGGKWTVVPVPLAQDPTIARILIDTKPNARFVMATFSEPITAGELERLVPNPLDEATTAPKDPWAVPNIQDDLERWGWQETAGTPGQSAGWYPGAEDNKTPAGAQIDTLTGRYLSVSGYTVENGLHAPYIWVAIWADRTTTVDGLIEIAPQGY